MSTRFDLKADDLKGINRLDLTVYDNNGEASISLHYNTPEQVEGLAERHGLPVEVDEAHEVDQIGTFRTVSISAEVGSIHVFAVGSRLLGHEAQAVTR